MDTSNKAIKDNEDGLKELFLEFAGSADAASRWPEFRARFSALAGTCAGLPEAMGAIGRPVLVLDQKHVVQWQNAAAAQQLGTREASPLEETAPWLADEMKKECRQRHSASGVEVEVVRPGEERDTHFSVYMAPKAEGCVLTLTDITQRVEAQRQLVRERNRSAHYLDVVGSMVVVLDASGSVTMVNQTACQVLKRPLHELVGRNWVEAVVPEEQRDEVLDYAYLIFSGQVDSPDEFFYYVTDGEGEHRLIQWQHALLENEGGMPVGVLCSGRDVTEQRATEEALYEKELWLRSTFVALGEAVFILTPDWRIIDANPAAETVFGMTNEELVNASAESLHVNPTHFGEFKDICREPFGERRRIMLEYPMRRHNGEVFPSEQSASLIIGDDGHPLGIVNTIRDISSRKRAERVLRESEEKFRRIFESIEEGYIITDLKGYIQLVNPATCRLFGYKSEELVGQTMDRLFQDRSEQQFLKKGLKSGKPVRNFKARGVCKDGSVITVDGNAHVVFDDNGEKVGLEGTFRDITRQIEAEKVLLEREQQYRAFFENNHAIMLLVEPKTGMVVDANPAASDFYGYSQKSMRSMYMDQINVLDEEEMFREMELARKEKRAYFIFRHVLSDGEERDVEVYSGPIMVQGRQLLYSVIHDVTKRIQLESEMKTLATTDALTGVNNRHQFFTTASHELRRSQRYKKPLTVLMLDIDYFKSINDTHGHQTGDEVLRSLARTASSLLRDSDVFGRLGGEEFAVVLPETGLKLGLEVAERLRNSLSEVVVEFENREISFTVSIGATLARRSDKAIEDVIKRADEALYKAKRMGRNRVDRA